MPKKNDRIDFATFDDSVFIVRADGEFNSAWIDHANASVCTFALATAGLDCEIEQVVVQDMDEWRTRLIRLGEERERENA